MKNENGIEKSAILTGQTLVNIIDTEMLKDDNNINAIARVTLDKDYFISDHTAGQVQISKDNKSPLEGKLMEGKTYTLVMTVNTTDKTSDGADVYFGLDTTTHTTDTKLLYNANGVVKIKFTPSVKETPSTGSRFQIGFYNRAVVKISRKIMLLEGDYTNVDIPYFEGMQSVKMPVLTTTGKNLFDYTKCSTTDESISITNNGLIISTWSKGVPFNHNFTPNTTYTTQAVYEIIEESIGASDLSGGKILLTNGKDYIALLNDGGRTSTFTTPSNIADFNQLLFYSHGGGGSNDGIIKLTNIQIEQGTQVTSYEPYKSNILTVNEEVKLRGIGNVQDTLDCLTGEVTKRIGEIVLDGSQSAMGGGYIKLDNAINDWSGKDKYLLSDKLPTSIFTGGDLSTTPTLALHGGLLYVRGFNSNEEITEYFRNNPTTVQYRLAKESIKTVDLTIQDQDNQPQERMKLFPTGYINTSSSTFPPILELKGITHNNKLNMTTTNGTNNTQLITLDNLALDGIVCQDGTVVRDSYDVESGLYTKRVFRFTIDEEFVEKYRSVWVVTKNDKIVQLAVQKQYTNLLDSVTGKGVNNNIPYVDANTQCCFLVSNATLYIKIFLEEMSTYDVDGLLDWIKRNGAIEVAYQLATPQIIHMQPNMTPYVSTRPYQGSIESQGNILESSFLDYTSEQSIISPKPLGDGDVLRWEQGSQCYVYENDKEYIPLTDYNQPMGTVLDLEEEDGEQFIENLDGGDIIVDIPFKEKAVYERHLVSHEDNVIYPTQDKLDPTDKIEVDYICGETWQNPNDLADIRHVGTLREDGQYDVTIRRSGDDEIRLMDGATNIGLDGDGLNPSEFELTYFNSGGVEVGKYGDTSHTLEDCVLDSKLETGMVYGETLVNVFNYTPEEMATWKWSSKDSGGVAIWGDSGYMTKAWAQIQAGKTYTMIYVNAPSHYLGFYAVRTFIDGYSQTQGKYSVFTVKDDYVEGTKANFYLKSSQGFTDEELANIQIIVVEGDYTSYPMDIPYFEGVGSTIVNGFTTVGKNLFGFNDKYEIRNSFTKHEILDMNSIIVSPDTTSLNWISVGFYNYYLPHKTTDYFIISRKEEITEGNPYDSLNLYDADDDVQMTRLEVWEHNGYKYDLVQFRKDGERANIRFYCGSNEKMGTIKYSDIQITKYSQRPSRINEEFEPYKGIAYTLPTPITLNKVGDVADTYDVVSGVETRNVEIADMVNRATAIFDLSNDYPDVVGMSMECGNSDIIIINGSFSDIDIPVITNDICHVAKPKQNTEGIGYYYNAATKKTSIKMIVNKTRLVNDGYTGDTKGASEWIKVQTFKIYGKKANPQTIQHTLIPSTVETTQEPTFILPQPLRSVPNGICDRLYWDENKGHYCIEKRIEEVILDGSDDEKINGNGDYRVYFVMNDGMPLPEGLYTYATNYKATNYSGVYSGKTNLVGYGYNNSATKNWLNFKNMDAQTGADFRNILKENPTTAYYPLAAPEIIDLPHLNKKLTLPTQPDTLPIGYKVEYPKANPQLGLTVPYKQLNYPSRPQNIDFKMDIADYVLTWDDVKEARQYNVILNDRVIATVKEPQWNSGEEMYGYIMVEAQNEIAENLSEELYIKTVPNAPAQLTVGHNPMTNYYDFEISFIKTSAIAEYYTVQYRIDGGEWVYKTIQSDEIDPNSKVLWSFSVYEINKQIEVWATATNEIGTNDILPIATYYMSPTPQWTYRINSKELFVRWMDDSPYDTQYKLRYQYKSDGIYRYAYFEGDKQEIGKLYEALIPLADDEEVSIALCVISEKENLYTKPIKASKELDPNIKPPKNFNYHWLARGLIEFYWEDNYDVDVEYEAIVEHRLTSGNNEWITDTRIFSATDTEGTGTVYRLSYQLEDLEEIRVKVRMKWAMNETEWSESLTTVFIPVEGNPPQWIRRTQTQEGLLVEWEAQEYVDSYHVYVMSNGEELQHLETMDNFIYVDLDYSNTIDIEIYEATRFSGGIQSDPTDKMCFRPTMDKHQLIHDVVTPDTLTYEIEVDTIQKGIKERQVIHDINTTPKVTSKQPMDVSISSPFTLSFHPLQLDVHQSGSKYYGDTELHIKTLDVKSRDAIEVLTFERITDQYGVDFTVYTPSASKYPITLEVNRVRIVCFGDSLTSGHPGFWE